jgi:DNA-directed RNA polymerase specialized sigma24 family protein
MNNFRKRAQMEAINELFADENFVDYLKGFAEKNGLSREGAEDAVQSLWLKLKVFSGRGELPTGSPELRTYIVRSLRNLIISEHRKRKSRPEHLITDEGWRGGSLKGIDISQEEVADRGIGSFPSNPDDRILLEQMHSQFGPEGTALKRMDKEDMRNLMDLAGGLGELNPTTPGQASIREVAKRYMMDEEGFDWDAEMRAAREERDPDERRYLIESLVAKLDTTANTLGRRLLRGQERMREYAKASLDDIASLSKIATKLDSLGLTKEADVLDSFIRFAQLEDSFSAEEEMDYSSLPGDVRDFIRESERVLDPNVFHHFTEGLNQFLSEGGTPNINVLMKLVEEAKAA